MKNFGRAVRLALRYRFTLAAAVVCALMVGLLWGANIATVKPFVEVAFNGHSLQDWVAEEIAAAKKKIDELSAKVQRRSGQLDRSVSKQQRMRLQSKLAQAQSQLKAEHDALDWYQRLQPYVDRYLPAEAFATLLVIAAVLLAGTLLKIVFLIGNTILVSQITQLAVFDLRKRLYRRTLRMHLGAFDADGNGELMSRFTYDMESVSRGMNLLFGKVVREPLKMLACLVGAALICWRLLLVSLVLAPLAALAISRLAKILKRANRRAMEEMSQIYTLLDETFSRIKIVKAFAKERHERRRFHHNNKKYFRKSMRIVRYDSLTRPVTELMGVSTILLALLCGAYLVLEQETHLLGIRMCARPLSLSSLLLFYGMLSGVSDPARKLSEVFNRLQRAAAACDRIYAFIDRQPEIRDPAQSQPLPRHQRQLEFKDLRFHYAPGKPVLENVNLQVKHGETVALVGPNGCGKTTMVNLLMRFFDPCQGAVLFDGLDIRQARIRDVRGQIGMVPQQADLFDDSVEYNIRYGRPDATREQVVAAAKKAHAHRFIIQKLADGYDTIVGPGGGLLSGGQRQRIALARAILLDPPILILDEATSQIDPESEQLIHRALQKFLHSRTAVIITHRMSTLALADRIVVMNAGRIVDVGSHEELIGRCDVYQRLYDVKLRDIA